MNKKCKKCGELIHKDELTEHFIVCQDTMQVDPEEVLDSFESLHYRG